MAFCMNCGAELQKGAAFCIKCGTKIEDEESVNEIEKADAPKKILPKEAPETEVAESVTPERVKKKSKLPLMLIACIALLTVGAGAVFGIKKLTKPPIEGGTSFKLLDIYDCVSVTTDGYDGAGVLEVSVDNSAIEELLRDDYYELSSDEASDIAYSISVNPAQTDSLSNGQEVLMTVGANTGTMTQKGIRLKEFSWNYQVGGLTPVKEINPFDYVDITYEGISPYAEAHLDKKSFNKEVEDLSYEISKSEGIVKGENLTVTCTNDPQAFLENGIKLTETTKTFTVDNIKSYIKSPEELNDAVIQRMKTESEDSIGAMLEEARHDKRPVNNTGLKYEGLFILSSKDQHSNGNNEVILVYTTQISSERLQATTVYYPFRFFDVVQYEDGIIDYGRYETAYGHDSDLYPFGYNYEQGFWGFSDSTTMFSVLARSRTDEFTYEVSEDLKDLF